MLSSFKYAVQGLKDCLRTERNLRFHVLFACYVVVGGFITQLNAAQWLAIIICIGAVISAELFNTAIEALCNALHPGQSAAIGHVKDIAAAGVLVLAVSSATVGGFIFFRLDKLSFVLSFVQEKPLLAILLILTLPVSLYLIFRSYEHDKISYHHNRGASKRR